MCMGLSVRKLAAITFSQLACHYLKKDKEKKIVEKKKRKKVYIGVLSGSYLTVID